MKKSLLLIRPIFFGVILTLGHCPFTGIGQNKSDEMETVGGDTTSIKQTGIPVDTLTNIEDTSSFQTPKTDTTKPVRIEHGSDDPAKLDSIKKAKQKRKH